MTDQPYLSIVAASRNDNHGGDILKRMTLFVRGLIAQANRHRLVIELIIVEWNPPSTFPLLQEVLPRPSEGDYLTLRYIIVPPTIHNTYKRAKEIPLFQMIAKNVGIRRARGEFVLCTNIDLLFSDALFKILAAKKLRKDSYYRANRCDVPDTIVCADTFDEQLAWCKKNIIRRLGRDTAFKNINLELVGMINTSYVSRWMMDKVAWVLKIFWPPEKSRYYQVDSFACGDFTLMSKNAWANIQGYLELDLYSLHIDSLGILAAMALGYRQETFPREACTYHIDHAQGWESMTPIEKVKFLEERPGFDYSLVYELGQHILRHKTTFHLNGERWGYADHVFEEYSFPGSQADVTNESTLAVDYSVS